jgi:hypothetical protein
VRELTEARPSGGTGSPAWLTDTEEALQKLLSLPPNWDSYDARPIAPEIVRSAVELLRKTARAETPRPTVVPTVRGGVQIEWHIHGIWIEIELLSAERVGILYEDRQDSTELELDLRSDTARLSSLIARLAPEVGAGSPGGKERDQP